MPLAAPAAVLPTDSAAGDSGTAGGSRLVAPAGRGNVSCEPQDGRLLDGTFDESGPQALVQLRTPVNKFPDFVRYAVQRLQAICPTLGKNKLAQVLARANGFGNALLRGDDPRGRFHCLFQPL